MEKTGCCITNDSGPGVVLGWAGLGWAGLGGVGTCVQAALSLSQLWPHTRHFYKLCSHLL